MKKRMFLSTILMTLVLLLAVTTATFAWYQVSSSKGATQSSTPVSDLAVLEQEIKLGGVKFVVTPNDHTSKLLITDRAGNTYYKSGDVYVEIHDNDLSKKQASVTFNVSITDEAGAKPSADLLATVAGDYTVTVTAAGSAKISLDATAAEGTSTGAEDAAEAVEGALGAAAGAEVVVMYVNISAEGAVTYKLTSTAEAQAWAEVNVAKTSAPVHYGLQVKNYGAEANPAIDAATLTPSVKKGGTALTPAA